MTEKLTKATVARMKSGAKERVAFDEELPGFAVKVLPSGRRVFIFQYRHGGRGGRLRRITISEFRDPPLTELDTVDGARRKAAEYRAEVLRGEDPFATLQAAKAAEIEAARREAESPDPKTVTNLATEYLARWASKKRDGGTADKRALDKDVLPEIGALPMAGSWTQLNATHSATATAASWSITTWARIRSTMAPRSWSPATGSWQFGQYSKPANGKRLQGLEAVELPPSNEDLDGIAQRRDERLSDEILLAELSKLNALDYGKRRKAAAKKLGITTATLDKIMAERRVRRSAQTGPRRSCRIGTSSLGMNPWPATSSWVP
jgi:hypothetical protein